MARGRVVELYSILLYSTIASVQTGEPSGFRYVWYLNPTHWRSSMLLHKTKEAENRLNAINIVERGMIYFMFRFGR